MYMNLFLSKRITTILLVLGLCFHSFSVSTAYAVDTELDETVIEEEIQQHSRPKIIPTQEEYEQYYSESYGLIREALYNENVIEYDSAVDTYIRTQQEDGSWRDFIYATVDDSYSHLSRLMRMAGVYTTESSIYYNDESLAQQIEKGLSYWYDAGLTPINVWWGIIGQQQIFTRIIARMYGHISDGIVHKMCSLIVDKNHAPTFYQTGTNLTWLATFTLYRGVYTENPGDINMALEQLLGEITTDKPEGPQVDGSFFQHGRQIYNNGYGLSFFADNTRWVRVFNGTAFEYPEEKLKILVDVLLDGSRWMRRGRAIDQSVNGRAIVRPNETYNTSLITPAKILAEAYPPRRDELLAFAEHMQHGMPKYSIIGNKYFWVGDYIAHHRENYYTVVNTASRRTVRNEQNGTENIYGYWLNLGTNYVYREGDDYHMIYPFWDWRRIPGVTAPLRLDLIAFNRFDGGGYLYHRAEFVGGVSDGMYGANVMQLEESGMRGSKSWFFFDDEYVSLGSGITSTNRYIVGTTIDQRYANGNVEVNGKVIGQQEKTIDKVENVYHDKIGYIFPAPTDLFVKNTPVTAVYRDMGAFYRDRETITKEIFTLWIGHGIQPSNAKYAYITLPYIGKDEWIEYQKDVPVEIIENSNNLQCVYHNKLNIAQMIFIRPGKTIINDTLSVSANRACAAIVTIMEDGIKVNVADPLQNENPITVKVEYNNNIYTKAIPLPTGQYAGDTAEHIFEF